MNKEQIYDDEISPLMAKIIEISKRSGIAMFATFHVPNDDDETLMATTHQPDENGKFNETCRKCCALTLGTRNQVAAFTVTTP